jgi:2-C-methyl-D-erythritol 2,4-cyclodiphosphate synthase
MSEYRVGQGFDIHLLVPGRPLFLGGIKFESPVGLSGHSDADVVLHSLTDALLGASGYRDIGQHFPDTDERWRNASSKLFVQEALRLMKESGFRIGNVDITVFASSPPIAPHAEEMCRAIATLLGCEHSAVNIKAKTFQGIGEIGKGKAIAAQTVALLRREGGKKKEEGRRKRW